MTARSAEQVRRYLQRHAHMADWVALPADDDPADAASPAPDEAGDAQAACRAMRRWLRAQKLFRAEG